MFDDKTLTINKRYFEIEDVSKDKKILKEQDKTGRIIQQYMIDYGKFKDKLILSKMTVRQLKNLIKRCEEVIQDKESEKLLHTNKNVRGER